MACSNCVTCSGVIFPERGKLNFVEHHIIMLFYIYLGPCPWGVVAQSIRRATPGEEIPGSIPAVATRSLLVGSVSV